MEPLHLGDEPRVVVELRIHSRVRHHPDAGVLEGRPHLAGYAGRVRGRVVQDRHAVRGAVLELQVALLRSFLITSSSGGMISRK